MGSTDEVGCLHRAHDRVSQQRLAQGTVHGLAAPTREGSARAGDDGWWRYRPAVGTKAERRAASERVAAYHEARLVELVEYITAAIDRYRAGEIDAYTVDETIHHYHRAARELWKFCWSGGGGTHVEMIAHLLDRMATDGETINWWERVSPRQRD